MPSCLHCGTENETSARFCESCGNPLPAAAPPPAETAPPVTFADSPKQPGVRQVPAHLFSDMSKWAGFVGIVSVILGVLSAFLGLFTFVISAITGVVMIMAGVIMIIMGTKLRSAKGYADQLMMMGDGSDTSTTMIMLISALNSYFMTQGICIIFVLFFWLFGIVLLIVRAASLQPNFLF